MPVTEFSILKSDFIGGKTYRNKNNDNNAI